MNFTLLDDNRESIDDKITDFINAKLKLNKIQYTVSSIADIAMTLSGSGEKDHLTKTKINKTRQKFKQSVYHDPIPF